MPTVRDIKPLERGILFGVQNDTLHLLHPLVRATFRHAWRALYRNLTLVDTRDVRFSLDRTVLETLLSLRDAALRHGHAHRTALCRWDGVDATERPELQPLAAKLIEIDSVSKRPDIVVKLTPEFQSGRDHSGQRQARPRPSCALATPPSPPAPAPPAPPPPTP